jgi:hypothetical protein
MMGLAGIITPCKAAIINAGPSIEILGFGVLSSLSRELQGWAYTSSLLGVFLEFFPGDLLYL